jgi:hypothetical protein
MFLFLLPDVDCCLQVCYHEWRPVDKKNIAVNSLVFHSSEPTWLFCGTNDGVVSLWDVGTPTLPTYDSTNPKQLLKLYPDYGNSMLFCVLFAVSLYLR